uniref:Putative ovule protein n=1 Tax=Solanum chacoense TaxID=4108 RepID=A0A0V0IZH0_SOLCH
MCNTSELNTQEILNSSVKILLTTKDGSSLSSKNFWNVTLTIAIQYHIYMLIIFCLNYQTNIYVYQHKKMVKDFSVPGGLLFFVFLRAPVSFAQV